MRMIGSVKGIAKRYLDKAGISIRRQRSPYLLQHPECELLLSFPFVIAHHVLNTSPDPFFFIQVGAYDGVSNDPINHFVRRLKWDGVLLEPQGTPFALLQKAYNDQPQLHFVQAALSEVDGTRPFYRVKQGEGVPESTQQLASFNKEVIIYHKGLYADIENAIITEQIRTISFPTILDTYHVGKLDLLQIDAEGYDFEILKMFPFGRIQPAIINYEHSHLKKEVEDSWVYLAERGYLLWHDHEDTTAYRKDLATHLAF